MSTRAQDLMFEAWIAEMPAAIAGFESRLRGTGFRADFSRRSLEDLERYMRDRWASRDRFRDSRTRDDYFIDGACRYVGETLLRACGGGWLVEYGRDYRDGRVFVVLDTDPTPVAPAVLVEAVVHRRLTSVLPAAFDHQMKRLEECRRMDGPRWEPPGPHVLGAVVPRNGPTELEAWDAQAPSRVEALRARVDPLDALLLDRTLESLSVVAALALADVDAGRLYGQHGELTEVHRQYEAYLGETVFRIRGGSWVLHEKQSDQEFRDRSLRVVTAGYERLLSPRDALQELSRTRSLDTLIDQVEVLVGRVG